VRRGGPRPARPRGGPPAAPRSPGRSRLPPRSPVLVAWSIGSRSMAAREGEVLWEPPQELLRDSKIALYMRSRGFESYEDLWRWSVDDLEGFWRSLWDLYGLGAAPGRVLASSEMPGAEWFPGTRLNYAEQLFRGARGEEAAIVHATESRPKPEELSWDD